ncbi:uncharacterized protein [Eurosta solidaginis]|uniref:uncharacterized protein n=1 Tax=Eurosta solidaginis TaxID=178769 RepID=UPI00353131A1
MEIDARWSLVKQEWSCFGCLVKGHSLLNCRRRKPCALNNCKRMHHQLLHKEIASQSTLLADRERLLNFREEQVANLFKVVPVVLAEPLGKITTYAMIGEGSSVTLLEDDVAAQLGLRGHVTPLTLQWYGDSQTTENSTRVSCEIETVIKGPNLPTQSLNKEQFDHLKNLPVQSYNDVKPVLLLGLDNAHLYLPGKIVEAGGEQQIAAATKLGWVVYGPHSHESIAMPRVLNIRRGESCKGLNKLLEEYFSIESFGVRNAEVVLESDANQRARKILTETTKDLGQRYEVGLLWRQDSMVLPSSYAMAKQRLLNVETRIQKDPIYAKKYRMEIAKYIDRGYAKLLTPEQAAYVRPTTWYLPHFGVVNPSKPEKLRIVFDAAAISNSCSLNSSLLKGPEQAQPLIAIIHKFRQGIVAVAGDIEEMFSQVRIREANQDSQRFLWRDGKSDKPIQTYLMSSMIFGAICSPCCAEHIKNVNARKYEPIMPRGSHAVIASTYVDDLIVSFNSADEALIITGEAIKINAAAGFKLRNFLCNNKDVQNELNGKNVVTNSQIVTMDHQTTTEKVLGMYWNTTNDALEFHFQFHKIARGVLNGLRMPTKRELLGISMSIYDPFRLLANVTIYLKILMQSLWRLQVKWDETVPHDLAEQWKLWWSSFQSVKDFSVPRCYSTILSVADDIQLHVFVDASEPAYAAVAYLRIRKMSKIDVTLICAKSRCTPFKGMTIPRLELQAAVQGCRLKESMERCHDFHIHSTPFWSDSKTVISWIRSINRNFKQFVACRIFEHNNREPMAVDTIITERSRRSNESSYKI